MQSPKIGDFVPHSARDCFYWFVGVEAVASAVSSLPPCSRGQVLVARSRAGLARRDVAAQEGGATPAVVLLAGLC